ncbi:unnamed protein product [Eruca vesicaria subsp. sativa]|uniref:Uncharacterized protein n=1 Tax=Eruca vesicaria subsp. sativa TaxID=29727 RepID=A0ABC8JEK9_ERUVS|nr:unnamed protein product [Eruca vesicaria subsp. sativa]
MAGNMDLKMKGHMKEDEGETLKEAYERGMFENRDHERYRAILLMYHDQNKAIEARHQEELNKVCIAAKLEYLKECKFIFYMYHEKKMAEFELVLAESKLEDVKVPTIDWFKLGEPMMYD